MGAMSLRPVRVMLLSAALAVGVLALAGTKLAGAKPDSGQFRVGAQSVSGEVTSSRKQSGPFSSLECSVIGSAANVNLDCDDPFPNNEPDIEVDPADPQHLIAGSNDFGSCCDEFYASFDGGHTWQSGNISREAPRKTGSDPVVLFDRKHGTAIHVSVNFYEHAATGVCDADVVASVSRDGGLRWDRPAVIDDGTGCQSQHLSLFNDKEAGVTDNNPSSPFYGRTYVTWQKIHERRFSFVREAIYQSHSDDGGETWSKPIEISGANAALCPSQETGPPGQCDESFISTPTVAPDGSVYVAFLNMQNPTLPEPGESQEAQYLIVRSTDGGATWSAPRFVAGLESGERDYPIDRRGRFGLTGYRLRWNFGGNLVASPVDGTLYLVFDDNRNGVHDSDDPVTNLDVFLVTSSDGGETWSGPTAVDSSPSDQWFPWVDVNPVTGRIGVLYNDRSIANPALYNAALSEQTGGGFTKTTVSTDPSHPTDSIFFQSGDPGCEKCATFHGDYIGLAYGPDGTAHMAWTDMSVAPEPGGGYAQFIFYANR